MDIMAIRLRTLREKMGMSQAKLAKEIGVTQASVNRYETARVTPPAEVLLFYADRFDVSLDYIYGRTEKPQGKLYNYQPKPAVDSDEMRKFVENICSIRIMRSDPRRKNPHTCHDQHQPNCTNRSFVMKKTIKHNLMALLSHTRI